MSRKFRRAFRRTVCWCLLSPAQMRRSAAGDQRLMHSPCYSDVSVTIETAVEVSVTKFRRGIRFSADISDNIQRKARRSPAHRLIVPGTEHLERCPKGIAVLSRMATGERGAKDSRRTDTLAFDSEDDEDADSVSSLPSTLAAYIREELELSQCPLEQ